MGDETAGAVVDAVTVPPAELVAVDDGELDLTS
jgi:hypothetical protein